MTETPPRYGPLTTSLAAPTPTRRAFSLPEMRSYMPFTGSSSSHILPLSSSASRPSSPNLSRKGKRLSFTLRSRASHNKIRLIIGSLLLTAIFLFVRSSTSSLPATRRFKNRSQLVLSHSKAQGNRKGSGDGVSYLDVEDTDEWLSEEDLFYSQYTEDAPMSAEDAAAEAEMASRKADVIEQNRQQSLRALTWWLAEGGEIPADWEVPSKAYLRKVGGRGVERMLEDIEDTELGDEVMFEEGWGDFAKKRYRIVVFSKTHCPYSRKAKQILSSYTLSPAPFVVELDTRPDMTKLQDLLQHLTGRRTVPNILLDFASIGGSDDLTLMHSEGGLQRRFEEMGTLPGRGRILDPAKAFAAAPVPAHANAADKDGKKFAVEPAKVEPPAAVKEAAVIPEKVLDTLPGEGAAKAEVEPIAGEEADEDELAVAALKPGAKPADVVAAVKAAHGKEYLTAGEDENALAASEEFKAKQPAPAEAAALGSYTQDEQLVPVVKYDFAGDAVAKGDIYPGTGAVVDPIVLPAEVVAAVAEGGTAVGKNGEVDEDGQEEEDARLADIAALEAKKRKARVLAVATEEQEKFKAFRAEELEKERAEAAAVKAKEGAKKPEFMGKPRGKAKAAVEEKKVDTLLDRANANAQEKVKPNMRVGKPKAQAGGGKRKGKVL